MAETKFKKGDKIVFNPDDKENEAFLYSQIDNFYLGRVFEIQYIEKNNFCRLKGLSHQRWYIDWFKPANSYIICERLGVK